MLRGLAVVGRSPVAHGGPTRVGVRGGGDVLPGRRATLDVFALRPIVLRRVLVALLLVRRGGLLVVRRAHINGVAAEQPSTRAPSGRLSLTSDMTSPPEFSSGVMHLPCCPAAATKHGVGCVAPQPCA